MAAVANVELTNALQKLGAYQPKSSSKSKELLAQGTAVLRGQGDDGWDSLEKLLLAAVDEGDLKTAKECLKLLDQKFPQSSRVAVLTGIVKEAELTSTDAIKYYDDLLNSEESANPAIWRRKAGVLRRNGQIDKAVEELSAMLDTYYAEVEGWLELADIYASCEQYTHALQALSHVLILAPQNPFHFIHFAETAYLVPDIPLALKMFLQAVDMTDDEEQDGIAPADTVPTGLVLRAWFGVKLCTNRLVTDPRAGVSSPSQTAAPKTSVLASLDELSTERLRTAYLETTRESPPAGEKALIEAVAKIVQ